jgi:Leu/Phe-tRNA-protein transferase
VKKKLNFATNSSFLLNNIFESILNSVKSKGNLFIGAHTYYDWFTVTMTKSETNHRQKKRGGFLHGIKQRKSGSGQAELEAYIPPYLRQFVTPYHDEFCYTRTCHYRLVAQLMVEGFLPIATEGIILPKLHHERCVIFLPQDLHISKSVRKKAKKYTFTINREFERVVQACRQQHGPRCWLYPELVQVFRELHQAGHVDAIIFPTHQGGTAPIAEVVVWTRQQSPVRLYSIEVWNQETGELVAGELGYTVGSVYTSLTGFSSQNNAGTVQLAALGRLLCSLGFSMWDLGMDMVRTLTTLLESLDFVPH